MITHDLGVVAEMCSKSCLLCMRPNGVEEAPAGTFADPETSIYTGADWFCTETEVVWNLFRPFGEAYRICP